jgi:HisA/HisF family protein
MITTGDGDSGRARLLPSRTSCLRSILPVIDLKSGQAVHAIAGNRSQYQPLVSRWSDTAGDIRQLLRNMREHLGFEEFYIADLDAILGTGHHDDLIAKLLKDGYQLWLDPGVRRVDHVARYLRLGVKHVILASETMEPDDWPSLPKEQLVFSLDLFRGQVRTHLFDDPEPLHVMDHIIASGFTRCIVLDIASVGTRAGCPTLQLCSQLLKRHPTLKLATGGGIRSPGDIIQLTNAGISRVLVSTWLHGTDFND